MKYSVPWNIWNWFKFFQLDPFYSLAMIRNVNFRYIWKDICFIITIVLFDKQIVKMQKEGWF